MRVTIIPPDGVCGMDGVFYRVSMDGLPDNIRAVQWNGSQGHTEWTDRDNINISTISPYQQIIDRWQAVQSEVEARAADPYSGMDAEEVVVLKRAAMSCGPLQIRKALRVAGLHQLVVGFIETADEEIQEAWEYAGEFKRLDPLVLGVQQALGKTDEEVDAIFQLALTF